MSLKTLNGEMDKVREYATKYSKQQMAALVQNQEMSLEDATMAGAMIDRIAATANKPPIQDVAHDINPDLPGGAPPPPPQGPPQGMPPPQEQPPAPPQEMPPQQPPMAAAEGGLMHLNHGGYHAPSGLAGLQSNIPEMAGGGIVAFSGEDGSLVPGPQSMLQAPGSMQGGSRVPGYASRLPFGPVPQQPLQIPQEETLADITAKRKIADEMAGVDPNFFAQQQEENAKQKASLSKEKDVALGEGLMLFGVKLMGARKGFEWAAASEGAQQALLSIQGANREIKAQEREYNKASQALKAAEQQLKHNHSSDMMEKVQASKDRKMNAENAQTAADNTLQKGYFDAYVDLKKHDSKLANEWAIAEMKKASPDSTAEERNRVILEKIRSADGWKNPVTGQIEQGEAAEANFIARLAVAANKGKRDTHSSASLTSLISSDRNIYNDQSEKLTANKKLYESQFAPTGSVVDFSSLK
jgi:hypothetical protein